MTTNLTVTGSAVAPTLTVNPKADPLYAVDCSVRGGTTQPKIMSVEMERAMSHRYVKSNRKMRLKRVENMAHRILDGKWVDNGTARIFDKNGNALNSHHTHAAFLLAAEMAAAQGKPAPTMPVNFVWGIDHTTISTIDTNIVRTLVDHLTFLGLKFAAPSAVSEAARYLDTFGKPTLIGREFSPSKLELDDLENVVWRFKDELIAADKFVSEMNRTPGIRSALLIAIFVWGIKLNHTAEFINAVATGNNLTAGHPAGAFRNLLLVKTGRKKRTQGALLASGMEALKLFEAGQTAETIKQPKTFPIL